MEGVVPYRRAHELVASLTALNSLLHQNIEAGVLAEVAGSSVTFAQLRLLSLVNHRAHWSIGDMAECLRISAAAASKTVDRLVRHRLLRRGEAPEDRRVAELSLTERGRQLLRDYYAALNRQLELAFGVVPEEELERHADFLDCLSLEIRKHASAPDGLCLHCGIYARERCLLREQSPSLCFYTQPEMPERAKRRDRHGDRHS